MHNFALAVLLASPLGMQSKPALPTDPVVTRHTLGSLAYTATAGLMPLRNEDGETEGSLFYVAYTKDGEEASKRPVTFAFNGGPGSSSVWLHLGSLGPRKVALGPDGSPGAPPYRVVENPESWLKFTDVVMVDAMGTGYSRPAKIGGDKKFYGMRADIDAFGEFVRAYLAKYNRFGSPLFVCGESYGGIRGAGLSRQLLDRGIALNGLVVVSGVTNYSTIRFGRGHTVPYIGYLPSFAATAWYHKQLEPRLQASLETTLREAEAFASGEYAWALQAGTGLKADERDRVATKLASLTGLDRQYVLNSHLRITPSRFFKELLRDEGKTVGRLDSRFIGQDALEVGDSPEYDASSAAITPAFNAAINDYLARELKFTSDQRYRLNHYSGVNPWDYGAGGSGFPDTSEDLRRAMNENPHMKVLFLCGYYDLATPYYAMRYTVDQMDLSAAGLANISWAYYPAGHMMYIERDSQDRVAKDVASFYASATKR